MDPRASQLIEAAFEQARNAKKPDWRRMTTAVLKNRILALTGHRFDEREFGVSSFREFVRLAGDLISIDESAHPAEVMLHAVGPSERPNARIDLTQVRPDLWRAVMDYARGADFVWDVAAGKARVRGATDDPTLTLPTVSPHELEEWRREFFDLHATDLEPRQLDGLRLWKEKGLPSKFIPRTLLGTWNLTLKQKVVEILRSWFQSKALPEPPDLLRPRAWPEPLLKKAADPASLRQLVLRCVQEMDEGELAGLKIPVGVVARALRARSGAL